MNNLPGIRKNVGWPVWMRYLSLLVVSCVILKFGWTGFIASDDKYYAIAGLGWLHQFPYIPNYFGTVRTAIAIPIAVMIGLFGEREFTIVLSTCLFFLATVFLTQNRLGRVIGCNAAWGASLIMATVPLFALNATIPCDDIPELFFVVGSFWLFWSACQASQRFWLLLVSGISAGLAFSAHEITIALLLFYGLLFVAGYGIHRGEYWIIVAGLLIVLGLECAYYWTFTGNPFYRFKLLLLSSNLSSGDRIQVGFLEISASGTLHIWDPIDPLIMLLTKHHFGLLGFAAIPALYWAFVSTGRTNGLAVTTARLFAKLGLVWMIFVSLVLRNLLLMPRYYMVSAYCFFIVVAIWVTIGLWPRHAKLAGYAAILFVMVNLSAIYLDNKNPRFGERALIEYAAQSEERVYTDPKTADDAQWYCRWTQIDCARIVAASPPSGTEYFYNPKNADQPNRLMPAKEMALYQPKPEWQEVWRSEEPRRFLGIFIEKTGLGRFIPEGLYRRIDRPNPAVVVFRVSESPQIGNGR